MRQSLQGQLTFFQAQLSQLTQPCYDIAMRDECITVDAWCIAKWWLVVSCPTMCTFWPGCAIRQWKGLVCFSTRKLDSIAWQHDSMTPQNTQNFAISWYCLLLYDISCVSSFDLPAVLAESCWLGGCRAGIYDCFASGPELAFEQCLGASHWASPLDMKILAVKPVTCVIFSEVPEALAHFERWTGAQTSIYTSSLISIEISTCISYVFEIDWADSAVSPVNCTYIIINRVKCASMCSQEAPWAVAAINELIKRLRNLKLFPASKGPKGD